MRTTTDEIQQLYEDHGFGEGAFHIFLNGMREHIDRLNHVSSLIWDLAPVSILDVACQRGHFGSLALWNHGTVKRLVGVDINRLALRDATTAGYHATHCVNVAEPFYLNETFDLVLCMELLEHVPVPQTVVQSIKLHVNDGGKALFSCPEEWGDIDGEFHVRRVRKEELEDWVRSAGFQILDSHFFPSKFCEKPKWQGWNYVLAQRGHRG